MKKFGSMALALAMAALFFAACGGASPSEVPASTPAASVAASAPLSQPGAPRTAFRIAGMTGPTMMGMVGMMQDAEKGNARHDYSFEVFGAAAEINTRLIQGEIDVAALPANVASVLYNQANGLIRVAAINTLGVLYVVETGDTVHSVEDLRGRTIYSTGMGQTPQFALNYVLHQNGLNPDTDVTIEYKTESAEIATLLGSGAEGIALLPQPYVTVVMAQNENVRVALDMTAEWNAVSSDSSMVTGVLVARAEFIDANPGAFAEMLQDYRASIEFVQGNAAQAAQLISHFGIFENAAVMEKALPACNIVYIDGAEMHTKLEGYLQVLYNQEPGSVGGKMPDDAFYYTA